MQFQDHCFGHVMYLVPRTGPRRPIRRHPVGQIRLTYQFLQASFGVPLAGTVIPVLFYSDTLCDSIHTVLLADLRVITATGSS
jgi:hypothetical protein